MVKNIVKIDHTAVREVLTSSEMEEDLMETAEKLVGGKKRYTISKSTTNTARAVVNIKDENPDAFLHEMRTNELQKMSRRKAE